MRNKVAKALRRIAYTNTVQVDRYEDVKHPPKDIVFGFQPALDMSGNLVPIKVRVEPITTRLVEGPRLVYQLLKRNFMRGTI